MMIHGCIWFNQRACAISTWVPPSTRNPHKAISSWKCQHRTTSSSTIKISLSTRAHLSTRNIHQARPSWIWHHRTTLSSMIKKSLSMKKPQSTRKPHQARPSWTCPHRTTLSSTIKKSLSMRMQTSTTSKTSRTVCRAMKAAAIAKILWSIRSYTRMTYIQCLPSLYLIWLVRCSI